MVYVYHDINLDSVFVPDGNSQSCTLLSVAASVFFFSSRRRHTRLVSDWSSDVCSSDLSQESAEFAGRLAAVAYWVVGIASKGVRMPRRSKISRAKPCQLVVPLDVRWYRSEERRVGKECRSRWSPYH